MSTRVRESLNGSKKEASWSLIVGYTIDQLKKHLEKKFNSGMSWGNYGKYWHIDHRIPISVFNFNSTSDIDFKKCWALSNLQPLLVYDNISKGAKLEKPFQPSLTI